jgi:predicted NUDIX family NTP pyrophosphohydrolase
MSKQSAGILLYKYTGKIIQVLLVHPGGPFWAKRDLGVWSIPKGELEEGEAPTLAAKREFFEEVGQKVPAGDLISLGEAKQASGKVVYVWALQADLDVTDIKSNTFKTEWPPKSGVMQEFPENDRAAWFDLNIAKQKLFPYQSALIDRLAEYLQIPEAELPPPNPVQQSLL